MKKAFEGEMGESGPEGLPGGGGRGTGQDGLPRRASARGNIGQDGGSGRLAKIVGWKWIDWPSQIEKKLGDWGRVINLEKSSKRAWPRLAGRIKRNIRIGTAE